VNNSEEIRIVSNSCVCIILFLLHVSAFLESLHLEMQKYKLKDNINITRYNDASSSSRDLRLKKWQLYKPEMVKIENAVH
jgi:hypothetical protein